MLKAQDPVYSQYYSAPIILNPALTGVAEGPNINLNYRNQWPSLQNAYQTYSISYDQFSRYLNSGFGLYLSSDRAGDGILKTNKLGATYAYQLRVNRTFRARLGVEVGFVQSRLDWDKLLFADQIDPINGPSNPGGIPIPSGENVPEDFNINYLDMGTGFVLYSEKLYVGANFRHLNTPAISFLGVNDNLAPGLPVAWSVHAGSEWSLWGNNKRGGGAFLSPSLLYVKQGPFSQLVVGTFASLDIGRLGLWYRHTSENSDAIIAALGVNTEMFEITYSYDLSVSPLIDRSGGSHEISLGFRFQREKESIYSDCFNIFR